MRIVKPTNWTRRDCRAPRLAQRPTGAGQRVHAITAISVHAATEIDLDLRAESQPNSFSNLVGGGICRLAAEKGAGSARDEAIKLGNGAERDHGATRSRSRWGRYPAEPGRRTTIRNRPTRGTIAAGSAACWRR